MKKNYTSLKKILLLTLTIGLLSFAPFFVGSGLDNPEPIRALLNGNFPDISPSGEPYVEVFPSLKFDSPLTFTPVPNSDVLIVGQRDGKIYWFNNDPNVATKNLLDDMSDEVGVVWDGGFLGLSIHPQFGQSADKDYFYIFYTTKDGQGRDYPNAFIDGFGCDNEPFYGGFLILKRIEVDPNNFSVKPNSELVMMKMRLFGATHRGGGISFGKDGFLYIPTGDQTAYSKPQNTTTNLDGGVLRIDVDMDSSKSHAPIRRLPQGGRFNDEISGVGYYIPNDNPFLRPDGSRFEEYYSIGHRNPHRMTMDRATGTFYIGEIGESTHEEVNVLKKGKNYGWPIYEGYQYSGRCTSMLDNMSHEGPLVAFPRSQANAIIGGYVYRGTAMPNYYGKYICADYGTGEEIWAVDTVSGDYEIITQFSPTNIISFGEDNDGELYLLSQGNNVSLYKLRQNGEPEGDYPILLSETGIFMNLETLEPNEGVIPYDMIESFWSDGAEKKRWMAIPNDGSHNTAAEQISFSQDGDWQFPEGSVLIKHFELPIDENDPSITKRLETRISVKTTSGSFYYLVYKWNDAGTDAELLESGLEENVQITKEDGSIAFQKWTYPARQDCISCHNPATGGTLGPRTRYLNSEYTYEKTGRTANQLVTLSHLGILNQNITDASTETFQTYKALDDQTASLDDRARSYLDLNCAYCHRPGGTGERAQFDLRLANDIYQTGLFSAVANTPIGVDGEKILVPGDASKSILYHRTNSTDPTIMMPPIAKTKVDEKAVILLEEWINQMDAPDLCVASGTILMQSYDGIEGVKLNDLFDAPNYPDNPSTTIELNSFEIPTNIGDNYGVKVSGYLCAPETGTYYFWVAGDDQSQLNLSINDNLSNVETIANVPEWTNPREWNKFTQQKSAEIQLTAGQRYYIEAFMKEGFGGDNLSVGWRRPSDGNGSEPAEVVPGNVLSPITVEGAVVSVTGITVDPSELTLVEGSTGSLAAMVSPGDATDKSVGWSSSDDSVATVDDNGTVTAISAGTSTITVMTTDGGYTATSEITVEGAVVSVTGITVDPSELTLVEGSTGSLAAMVSPGDATDKSVGWSSSDDSVATVDDNGTVTAISAGTSTITVMTTDGGYTATSEITVEGAVVSVTGITVDPSELTLVEGSTGSLAAMVSPGDATDKSVGWSSSDDSVATVDDNGTVTAISAGTSTITVMTTDGGYTATSEITVEGAVVSVTGITVDPSELTLVEGSTGSLAAMVSPGDATDKSVGWSSR